MQIIKASLITLVSTFTLSLAEANLLIVSDVGDTIRISGKKKAWNGVHQKAFLGMADLYNAILESNANSEIVYVTSSSRDGNQQKFLDEKAFPAGQLYTGLKSKKAKISELIREKNPTEVILIADNKKGSASELSALVLDLKSDSKTSHIHFHTFIRAIWTTRGEKGDLLQQDQNGFTTPLDIALDLSNLETPLLPEIKVAEIMEEHVPNMLKEMAYYLSDRELNHDQFYGKDRYFESWQSCEIVADTSRPGGYQTWNNRDYIKDMSKKYGFYVINYASYLYVRGCLHDKNGIHGAALQFSDKHPEATSEILTLLEEVNPSLLNFKEENSNKVNTALAAGKSVIKWIGIILLAPVAVPLYIILASGGVTC